ncbi:MAG: 2-octaprenyl-6-methoxyphenyl hydroxylase [Gammaproteobacteria bacterium]|nr:2-octaprenyl-6-methoxyphenyl hydroxylase [Gammaproteobacteria bacterium]
MRKHFDVIIVGGGMVGASLARSLSGLGLSIAVLEAWALGTRQQPSYDDRAIALSYGTRRILQGMGLWSSMEQDVAPIRCIHVSDRGNFGFTRLDHGELDVGALGYVATGHLLGEVLLRGLGELPGVMLFCPASLHSFEVSEERAIAEVDIEGDRINLTARVLVAADGAKSRVRELSGIEMREWGYGQTAVISNLTPGSPQNGVAYERFTDQGPMAMLPLTKGRCGMVWTLDEGDVGGVMALDDATFLHRVQARFGYRLGVFQKAGRRSCYPLRLLFAREHVRPRVALIGNAAHALHPITGQGFNLGIRDVSVLADVLASAYREGSDIGAIDVLRRYADWRNSDQHRVVMLTDGLVRLFTNPLMPVRVLRNLGMLALDVTPPVKKVLLRQFMGLNGRLPRLSRGVSFD